MADVITRFKLETTQYDSKLRDASKGLAEYTRKATLAGNEFGKFTQKNIEAARALGTITPSATNAKDKGRAVCPHSHKLTIDPLHGLKALDTLALTYNNIVVAMHQIGV